jgi:hypothetical protein
VLFPLPLDLPVLAMRPLDMLCRSVNMEDVTAHRVDELIECAGNSPVNAVLIDVYAPITSQKLLAKFRGQRKLAAG